MAVDHELEAVAGGAGTARGSGGMASKLAAAKIAAWSGVRVVIASAARPGVLADAARRGARGGHRCRAPASSACPPASCGSPSPSGRPGTVVVDEGARTALLERGVSLLPAGVVAVHGSLRRRRRGRGGRPGRPGVRQGPDPPSRRPGQGAGRPAHLRPARRRGPRGRAPRRPGPPAVRPPGLAAAALGRPMVATDDRFLVSKPRTTGSMPKPPGRAPPGRPAVAVTRRARGPRRPGGPGRGRAHAGRLHRRQCARSTPSRRSSGTASSL